ncbi:MAG: hypothetical protein KGD63_11000 [Candidatus Lokiarchaeota archaeon]|nr:hypothetical protein [Candidatus Lokiarchaeota archaeon]
MSTIINKIKRLKLFFSDLKPILLSHHPKCDNFYNHVYHIRGRWLCIGCFTYYPTILITIVLSLILFGFNKTTNVILFGISFIFALTVLLNVFNLTKRRFLKISSKISLGIGTGLFIISTLKMDFLPVFVKFLCLLQVNFLAGAIGYIRANGIIKECKACEYKKDWKNCPGMSIMMNNLYKHGFKKEKELKKKT